MALPSGALDLELILSVDRSGEQVRALLRQVGVLGVVRVSETPTCEARLTVLTDGDEVLGLSRRWPVQALATLLADTCDADVWNDRYGLLTASDLDSDESDADGSDPAESAVATSDARWAVAQYGARPDTTHEIALQAQADVLVAGPQGSAAAHHSTPHSMPGARPPAVCVVTTAPWSLAPVWRRAARPVIQIGSFSGGTVALMLFTDSGRVPITPERAAAAMVPSFVVEWAPPAHPIVLPDDHRRARVEELAEQVTAANLDPGRADYSVLADALAIPSRDRAAWLDQMTTLAGQPMDPERLAQLCAAVGLPDWVGPALLGDPSVTEDDAVMVVPYEGMGAALGGSVAEYALTPRGTGLSARWLRATTATPALSGVWLLAAAGLGWAALRTEPPWSVLLWIGAGLCALEALFEWWLARKDREGSR